MFAQLIGDIAVVSAAIVAGLMILSLVIAAFVGWRIASRRIDIYEVEGTPSPATNTADSSPGAGGLCFCKSDILVE